MFFQHNYKKIIVRKLEMHMISSRWIIWVFVIGVCAFVVDLIVTDVLYHVVVQSNHCPSLLWCYFEIRSLPLSHIYCVGWCWCCYKLGYCQWSFGKLKIEMVYNEGDPVIGLILWPTYQRVQLSTRICGNFPQYSTLIIQYYKFMVLIYE